MAPVLHTGAVIPENAMRTKPATTIFPSEPTLATATYGPSAHSWPAALGHGNQALDTRFWQTRGARGLSWNRNGRLPIRRTAH